MIARFYAFIWLIAAVSGLRIYVEDSYNAIEVFVFVLLVAALLLIGLSGVLGRQQR